MTDKIRKLEKDDFWVIYQSTSESLCEFLFNERKGAEAYLSIDREYGDNLNLMEEFDKKLREIDRSLSEHDVLGTWEEFFGLEVPRFYFGSD